MTNIFKTNSRFSVLSEEIISTNLKKNKINLEEKKFKYDKHDKHGNHDDNSFKKKYYNKEQYCNDNKSNNNFTNRYSKEHNEIIEKEKKEKKEKIKAENFTKSMAVENFPDLVKKICDSISHF